MGVDKKDIKELYNVLLNIDSVEKMQEFFNDLCTYKEIEQMAQRLISAKLLLGGATYEEVMEKADQALYYSKKNGKNMYMYYDCLPEDYLKSLEEQESK